MAKNTSDELDKFYSLDNRKKSRYMEEYLVNGFNMEEAGQKIDSKENGSFTVSAIMRHCGFAGQNKGLYKRPIKLPSGATYQVTREDLEAFLATMRRGDSHQGKHRPGTKQSQPLYDFIVKRAEAKQPTPVKTATPTRKTTSPPTHKSPDPVDYYDYDDDDDYDDYDDDPVDYSSKSSYTPNYSNNVGQTSYSGGGFGDLVRGVISLIMIIGIIWLGFNAISFGSNAIKNFSNPLTKIPIVGSLFMSSEQKLKELQEDVPIVTIDSSHLFNFDRYLMFLETVPAYRDYQVFQVQLRMANKESAVGLIELVENLSVAELYSTTNYAYYNHFDIRGSWSEYEGMEKKFFFFPSYYLTTIDLYFTSERKNAVEEWAEFDKGCQEIANSLIGNGVYTQTQKVQLVADYVINNVKSTTKSDGVYGYYAFDKGSASMEGMIAFFSHILTKTGVENIYLGTTNYGAEIPIFLYFDTDTTYCINFEQYYNEQSSQSLSFKFSELESQGYQIVQIPTNLTITGFGTTS